MFLLSLHCSAFVYISTMKLGTKVEEYLYKEIWFRRWLFARELLVKSIKFVVTGFPSPLGTEIYVFRTRN